MYIGFDYGTSSCAVGVYSNNKTLLLPIENGQFYIPSEIFSASRELLSEFVARNIHNDILTSEFIPGRERQLDISRKFRETEQILDSDKFVTVGGDAYKDKLDYPEGFYAKSPKSYLGSPGLTSRHILFFEDLVSSMMIDIKRRAEKHLNCEIEDVVIGRPVNFGVLNTKSGNEQAIKVLETSAKRSGFKNIAFQYEPIAAGLAYENEIKKDQVVLVVDIGGGTTDCSMMKIGPSFRHKVDRTEDLLAHCGLRVGGVDFDIELAAKTIMPHLGMNSYLRNGLAIPTSYFFDSVRVNDVNSQERSYSFKNIMEVKDLAVQISNKDQINRFIYVLENKLNRMLTTSSEKAKIDLSSHINTTANLDYIETALNIDISQKDLELSLLRIMTNITALMDEAVNQAGRKPDFIFLTGGSGKSPIIRSLLSLHLPDIQIVDGDYFGSVASGLTLTAKKMFDGNR